jgi:hypothetical protein
MLSARGRTACLFWGSDRFFRSLPWQDRIAYAFLLLLAVLYVITQIGMLMIWIAGAGSIEYCVRDLKHHVQTCVAECIEVLQQNQRRGSTGILFHVGPHNFDYIFQVLLLPAIRPKMVPDVVFEDFGHESIHSASRCGDGVKNIRALFSIFERTFDSFDLATDAANPF